MGNLFIFLGLFAWIGGYLRIREGKNRTLQSGSPIQTPNWVYFICGKSKAPDISHGIMPLKYLLGQLGGILFLVFGIVFNVFHLEYYIIQSSFVFRLPYYDPYICMVP